jgi:hypothetical protein
VAKLPLEDHNVVPVDRPPYDLNVICAAPGCGEPTADAHHCWRRSFLAGAYDHVLIEGLNLISGNVIGLCRAHHNQIEAGAAWITLEFHADHGIGFYWTTVFAASQRLVYQPPLSKAEPLIDTVSPLPIPDVPPITRDSLDSENRDDSTSPTLDPIPIYDVQPGELEVVVGKPLPRSEAAVLADGGDPNICPSCKRPLPHAKLDKPHEAKRPRRTWSITVPVDERENGADVLDELLEASRDVMARAGLPYGEESSVRYFVLTAALGLFVQGGGM